MSRSDEEGRAFDDLCYESWRSGGSMDLDRDRFDSLLAQGRFADEISVRHMTPQRPRYIDEEQQHDERGDI